ncbi:paraslipin [Spirulina major CS-329]|jgi:regulator of protease activity HflC (stomatin/prohibitin superfamily)|uniref:SPFH domain-containing protein n=1 Tax=Spirulina TaxID=1154 RepID=UPI00232FC6F6|nr:MULTISPECIES: stomatin-like protein [Spirulina]MDB9493387.1 paraslipin [Spirulina subsalsa CS-330]MDB9504026.1 paraslipin [Spirulina major CS-329]
MESLIYLFVPMVLGTAFTLMNSIKIINEGNEALVERFGQYSRKLNPGLNIVLPVLETIVVEETTREKVLGIEPQYAITKDNVSLKVDAVVYWQIIDLERTFYVVEDIKKAIENLVLTTLRSAIGRLKLEETYSSRDKINQSLLEQLDEATANWGVKVTRIEVREISPAKNVMDSLELERAAESKKRAEIAETEGIVQSIELLSAVLKTKPDAKRVLEFLVAQRYVEANEKLGSSPNSKVLFMDPRALNEAMHGLMGQNRYANTSEFHDVTPESPPVAPANPPQPQPENGSTAPNTPTHEA